MSLITADAAAAGLTTHELPALLKRWIAMQEEMATLNAELKQRRTTSKALREMILKIMDSNKVVQLNISKGAVVHKTREVKEGLTPDYIARHCKEFFNGDEEKAAALVAYLNEHRSTVMKHDLRLVPGGSETGSNNSR